MLARARTLASPAEARALYREWAPDYDRDVYGRLHFTGTATVAALLAQHLDDRTARIIDLGCGTGAAGEALRRLGFERLDGLDLSPDMLAIARAKGIYENTAIANLSEPLAIGDAAYDAAISTGTFTAGHVDAAALPEVARIVRAGGLIACVVGQSFWIPGGFAAMVDDLAGHGVFEVVHDSLGPIRQGGEAEGRYLVLRRC